MTALANELPHRNEDSPMSRPVHSVTSVRATPDRPGPERGLEDPRSIPQSPDEPITEPETVPEDREDADSPETDPLAPAAPPSAEPGIVDPRNDQVGPDL